MLVAIGIHVWEDPAGLRRTCEAVARATTTPHRILLLGDGPDQQTRIAMDAMRLPQSSTPAALGAAACFNRLTEPLDADVFVFIESGCIPTQGWLETILATFEADPKVMLAGPSTNLSWNEQSACPTGDAARTRRGQYKTLGPLYSLAEFCYVVKRAAIERIGCADERYGLGPCWEMDYNIRAARAGFDGAWVCGAFVFRPAMPRRKQTAEAAHFARSKRLYQDKFCGQRICAKTRDAASASTKPYEEHCRGDECEHFAPRELIQIELKPPMAPRQAEPLVSCVMVTRGRPDYVAQSIDYFRRQSWRNRELIIVHDEEKDLPRDLKTNDGFIRTFLLPGWQSIGAKRNFACNQALGEVIAHWDDDDWYGPERLRQQVEPIVNNTAEITGLRTELFLDISKWRFWTCTEALHARMFVGNVHGGTLAYRRSFWDRGTRYPNTSLAEDAAFLQNAIRTGARLLRIDAPGLFVYVRHGGNSWQFECGEFAERKGWAPTMEPQHSFADDREFYVAKSGTAPAVRVAAITAGGFDPLVTCIMPTADRPEFVPLSIEYFRRQHYPHKELLILDDGRNSVADLIPRDDPQIRYVRLENRHTIGAKRNLACELAKGEIILHWDDDDWMAEWRISYQAHVLLRAGEECVCGLDRVHYYDMRNHHAWLYVYPADAPAWLSGNSLCYRRELVRRYRFPEINDGEDTRFVWSLPPQCVIAHPDQSFMVAMIHGSNASPKMTADRRWQSRPSEEVHRLMRTHITPHSGEGPGR